MIGKLLKGLLGRSAEEEHSEPTATEHYEGYEVRAMPIKEDAGWRVAGCIVLAGADSERLYEYVRADTYPSREDATTVSLRKGRTLIDEQGSALFPELPE